MLVTFKTDAHGDVVMFGEVALTLLKMLGHTGTVPSAIKAADIPAALARLRAALDAIPEQPDSEQPDPTQPNTDQDERAPTVSLAHRAVPLIALLSAAARAGEDVMWA